MGSETVSQNRYNQNTSTNLGEILKFKEDHPNTRNNLTIGTVLNLDIKSSQGIRTGRTLLDIIQADATGDSRKTWKNFRDKLRLKRANATWSSGMQRANYQMMFSTRVPTSDPDIDSPSSRTRSSSLNLQRSLSSLSNPDFSENDFTATGREEEEERETEGEGPVRMSLMSLLAEADREMGIDAAYVKEDDEVDQGQVEEENGENYDCCVCMVRHKGSAFIPCGHTFCRVCSRELFVQRGNCPICNGFISEILDIF
ncbi:E3 ubiquitin-protein ligase complex SLX5-SLX8 subunit SLX8 [Heracleum sosnowskyi]|uniref:E3 ubiquitin-protein ligase complex SLX5-SLX8 subunit SLX8 n=1 Tax=Heracleum sosnowskyi TaxID=360622 RepID=A0AAD8GSB9_9APIA|nr:E3 ubiquitin-protein ligase complex SLX5-SLX8 subunit SLX8 [Heracleum sosnowskyi]